MTEQPQSAGPAVDLLLFDLGGTLISDDGEAGTPILPAALLAELPRPLTDLEIEAARQRAHLVRASSARRYLLWQLCQPDRTRFVALLARAAELDRDEPPPPLRPHAAEVIASLRKEYQLGLFTNYPVEAQQRILQAHPALLSAFAAPFALPAHKPDPAGLLDAITAYGGDPQRTVVIGDRRDTDIVPAVAAGVRCILVTTSPHAVQEARGPHEHANAEVADLRELPEVLRQWALSPLDVPPQAPPVDPDADAPISLWRSRSCFACGTQNHAGLDLEPLRVGTEVTAQFVPKPAHRGWSRLVHGGILATALDEIVCLAAAQTLDQKVMTVKAELRYHAPAFLGETLTVRARPLPPEGRYQVAEGEITNPKGTVVARCKLFCIGLDDDKAARFLR